METSLVIEEHASFSVMVHYHIMKNAGSTISELLRREFSGAFAEVHGPFAGSMISAAELLAFIKQHPEIRAISSHHVRFPVPKEDRLHFAYCCFIRHPLDRLHSLYNFFRTTEESSVVGQLAQQYDASLFFSEMIDRFPNYVSNVQTSYLACSGFFLHPPDRDDLRAAIRVMQECSLPGVVHRVDESLAAAEYFLNPLYPGIRLHYSAHNVRREMDLSLRERERELREVCGRAVYERLRILNQLDMQLLRASEDEIERRCGLVPSFASRLTDFKERSSRPLKTKAAAAGTRRSNDFEKPVASR